MKKREGFVFIETIIVIVVVMVLLVTIYSSFSLILSNIKRKENYDNINDIYKANLISKLFTTTEVSGDYVILTSSNCDDYMISDCDEVMNELGISSIFINNSSIEEILASSSSLNASFISYLSVLDQQESFIIITSNRNNQFYYTSIILEG